MLFPTESALREDDSAKRTEPLRKTFEENEKMTRLLRFAAVLALVAGCSMFSFAGELVTNGGFETGDFTGWTLGGNCGSFCNVTTTHPHSGMYSAQLGPVGSDGTLSQTLSTVAGDTYTFSFWLSTLDNGTPNDFSAYFDGMQVLNFTNLAVPGGLPYTNFVFDEVASSNSTVIQFDFRNDPSFWYLDDVSVTGPSGGGTVPEPGSIALLGTGLLALGIAGRKLY